MHKLFSAVLIVALTMFPIIGTTATSDDAQKQKHINELIAIVGADKLGLQLSDALTNQMIADMQRTHPKTPPRAFAIIKEVMAENLQKEMTMPGGLMDKIKHAYGNYFTDQEIQGLIAFYKSDLGKKMMSEMPKILRDSMQFAQEMARRDLPIIQQQIQEKFKKEGIKFDNKK